MSYGRLEEAAVDGRVSTAVGGKNLAEGEEGGEKSAKHGGQWYEWCGIREMAYLFRKQMS